MGRMIRAIRIGVSSGLVILAAGFYKASLVEISATLFAIGIAFEIVARLSRLYEKR
jgi:hypothetical protein